MRIKALERYQKSIFQPMINPLIDNHPYIDKFIGDCIMTALGRPMKTEEDDAVLVVSTAEEIIITRVNRDLIGHRFKLEERQPVQVKDKALTIFNVKGINR